MCFCSNLNIRYDRKTHVKTHCWFIYHLRIMENAAVCRYLPLLSITLQKEILRGNKHFSVWLLKWGKTIFNFKLKLQSQFLKRKKSLVCITLMASSLISFSKDMNCNFGKRNIQSQIKVESNKIYFLVKNKFNSINGKFDNLLKGSEFLYFQFQNYWRKRNRYGG